MGGGGGVQEGWLGRGGLVGAIRGAHAPMLPLPPLALPLPP